MLSASYICGNQAGTVAMPLPLPLPLLQCTFLRALVRKCSTARTVHSYAYPRPPPPHSFPIPPHSTAKVMTNLDHFLDFIAPKFQPYGSLERYVRRMPFQALFFFSLFFPFLFLSQRPRSALRQNNLWVWSGAGSDESAYGLNAPTFN